jgi:hypothetical protein
MNNEVTFSIKIVDEGSDGIRKITVNTENLGKALETVTDKSSRMNGKLLDVNQASQSIMNLTMSMQQIIGKVNEMTECWEKQEDAELKLETVMKQRMNATESDIDSIKRLASEQQKLGVVGDEVQLAGAQQIATFVNQKSSIEQLIPAMNNLLVQRYGLNSSQEQAVEIGNLMGKAMQGQTTMLQRVGITFTDAQAKVIKYGNEQQRAAMLAQVITDNVGKMNEKFAQTDLGHAKQLSNEMGDLKEQVGKVLTPIAPLLTGLNELGMSVFGISALCNAVKGVATAFSLAQLKSLALSVSTRAQSAAAAIGASLNKLLGISLYGEAAAAGTATVATKAFQVAVTFGLAAALTAIGVLLSKLVTWIMDLCGAESDASEETEKLNEKAEEVKNQESEYKQKLQETRSELSIYINKLKDFHGSKEKEKSIVQELNNKYGDTMGYFSSVSEWYKALKADSEAYCQQMVIEARQRMLANQIAQAEQENHDIKYDQNGKLKKYSSQRETQDVWKSADGGGSYRTTVEVKGTSDLDKASSALTRNTRSIASWKRQMQEANKESQNIKIPVMGSDTAPNLDAKTGKGGKNGKDGKDELKLIANAESYKDLGNNIEYYEKKLEATKPSETETIDLYSRKIAALKEMQDKIKLAQTAATVKTNPEEIKNMEEADAAISYQQQLRKTADASEIAGIDATIKAMQRKKTAMEETGKSNAYDEKLDTYEEIDAEVSRLTAHLQTSGTEERAQITQTIAAYNRKKAAMEASDANANAPQETAKLTTLKELGDAETWYQQRMENADASELEGLQASISAIERKKEVMSAIGNLQTQKADVAEMNAMPQQEMTVKLKAIGFEGLEEKIKSLKKLLTQSDVKLGSGQKKDIENLVGEYTKYQKVLLKQKGNFKEAWSGVKGISGGIENLSSALKGNGNAWTKMAKTVDAGLEVYDGIKQVIQVMKALGIITNAQTASDKEGALAKLEHSGATGTLAIAQGTQAGASEMNAAASGKEAVADTVSAAAKIMKQHASIPWVGVAIGAGFVAAMLAVIAASKSSVPKFANGGIAYGPTLGIFGEYQGASNNPEVVAPLDKLQKLITPNTSADGGKVEFKLKGRRLVGVLDRENNIRKRS